MIDVGNVLGGDYRVDAKIGEGGFGAVYRAHQLSLDGPVAVKALLVDNVGDPEKALEGFRAEAIAIRKLAHAQIPAAYTMGIHDDGTPYLVMEWLEGRTLKDRLEQEGPFSEAAAMKTIEQLAKPLAHAHDHGLVHRDLKPANIFELPDGTIKLIDFGLAKYFGPAAERGKRPPTASNELKGTFWFMSPEAARGKPLDARADVYSLGAVLYNLLTGHLPFDDRFSDQNVPFVVALAQGERPLDPRKHRPSLRNDIADFVLQLMEVEPERRFQTMNEVERVARAIYLDPNKPLTGKPDDRTVARLTGKELPTRVTQSGTQRAPSKRLRVALIVAGLLAFGLASGLVGALIASRRSNSPPPVAAVPSSTAAAPAAQLAPTPPAPPMATAPAPAPAAASDTARAAAATPAHSSPAGKRPARSAKSTVQPSKEPAKEREATAPKPKFGED